MAAPPPSAPAVQNVPVILQASPAPQVNLGNLINSLNRTFDIRSIGFVLNEIEHSGRPALNEWKSTFVRKFLADFRKWALSDRSYDKPLTLRAESCVTFQQVTTLYDRLYTMMDRDVPLTDGQAKFFRGFSQFINSYEFTISATPEAIAEERNHISTDTIGSGMSKIMQGLAEVIHGAMIAGVNTAFMFQLTTISTEVSRLTTTISQGIAAQSVRAIEQATDNVSLNA
jgi:hypothetical protein